MGRNFLEINAALTQLIESHGNDRAAAGLVIQFAQDLPSRGMMVDVDISSAKKPDVSTGLTKETGPVTIRVERPAEQKELLAAYKARVGHYRLWREKNKVLFHHFWASGLTTGYPLDISEPETFVMSYHPATLELEWFAKIGEETRWRMNFLVLRWRGRFLVLLNQGREGERLPYGHSIKLGGRITPEDLQQAKRPLFFLGLAMGALFGLAVGLALIHYLPAP